MPRSRSLRPPAYLVAAALLAGACNVSVTLETQELEANIADELQKQVGVTPTSVECPEDVPADPGTTFKCTATADDGSEATITAKVGEGGDISWEVTETS